MNKRKKIMPETLQVFLRIVILSYLGFCLLMYLMQSSQIFVPTKGMQYTPEDIGLKFESIKLTSTHGNKITAWYVPAAETIDKALLFCHGNAGNISGRLSSIDTFQKMGLNVMIFDYQGYGTSEGKTTEHGTYDDAMAAWKYLTEKKGFKPENITIFGRSLGGGVAIELAEKVKPGRLYIESTFSSADDMAQMRFPLLPARLLCKFKYRNAHRIKNIHCPLLMAHSKKDMVIPYKLGIKVFNAANEPKQFVEINGNHNNGGIESSSKLREAFKKFLM